MSDLSYNLSGVVRHQGLPVANVKVILFKGPTCRAGGACDERLSEQRTNARGEFNFALQQGVYALAIEPGQCTRFLPERIENVHLQGNVNFSLSLSPGKVVSGTVLTSGGANPGACSVAAFAVDSGAYCAESQVDHENRYSLVLPAGRFCLVARAYATGEGAQPILAPSFDLIDLDADLNHDIDLTEISSLKGKVCDQADQPVEGTVVIISPLRCLDDPLPANLGLKVVCRTDEFGEFAFMAQAGRYDFQFQPPERSGLPERREQALEIGPDCTRVFHLPRGLTFSGKVVFEGEGLVDCLVQATALDTSATLAVKSGTDGRFSLLVPEGSCNLSVAAPPDSAAGFALAPWQRLIKIEQPTDLTIELKRGVALTAVVTDASGKPRTAAEVLALAGNAEIPSEEDWLHPLATAVTDESGICSFNLAPGRYFMAIQDQYHNAKMVEVTTAPQVVDLTWQGVYVVKIEVLSKDESPVSRCQVFWGPYGSRHTGLPPGDPIGQKRLFASGSQFTAEDGTCQIMLPAGVYFFRIQPPEEGAFHFKTIRQLSVGADLHRKVKLAAKQGPDMERGQMTLWGLKN